MRGARMERLAWFSIVALLLVAGPPALGDESRWKALYDEGRDAQEEGQHAKAIAKFSAALEAGPDPRNRATILQRMAESQKALDEKIWRSLTCCGSSTRRGVRA